MSRLVDCLARRGDDLAVVMETATATDHLSYRALASRVDDAADRLGAHRRLVMLETRNDIATLVGYLGALAGHHVVLPVPPGRDHDALLARYRPDVVIGDGIHDVRHPGDHELHPDLALLLSTSGSTGSPKLVRLSRTNLVANAAAISSYLDIRATDRAATTLPMSYCYGLSVIHSHLLSGAGVILTDRSVVDEEFWELFRREGGTNFAGVPYTFELLERAGFAERDLPALRFVTQAGGRLPPDRVRRFAALGRRRGWDLIVMYGATEATARMAYLPADLAESRAGAIGKPIPGGSFALEPVDGWTDPDVGELVYRGPNVMMGYASSAADLASGSTVDALRTGDIARRAPDGLYEIIARRNRVAKLYGLRLDLNRVENTLGDRGVPACCTEDEDRLVVAAAGRYDEEAVQQIAVTATGLPHSAVSVVTLDELPRLSSGKPDYGTVAQLARDTRRADTPSVDLRGLFADVLHVDPAEIGPESSFVGLGGDSLSYVAMSVRLERALGRLPAGWHRMPLRDLQRQVRSRPRFTGTLETSVALRAAAILLIVANHADLFELMGGAHILLGIAGYNFGRFFLTGSSREQRARHLWNMIAWIALPSIAWIALALVISDYYQASNLFLLNEIIGPHGHWAAGQMWFIEVLVYFLIVVSVVCWLPVCDRWERARPFTFAAVFLGIGIALRYDVFGFDLGGEAVYSVLTFWIFALGWAAAKASAHWQRLAVTIVLAVSVYGFFGDGRREALVIAGLAALIWIPTIRCPWALIAVAGVLANASLFIYLIHWHVFPLFGNPLVGVVASLVAGAIPAMCMPLLRRRIRMPKPATLTAAPSR